MLDNQFIRGQNPMTKMEIRNTIISYLQLDNANNVLDIGAGTGSVTVQMGKNNLNLKIFAIEKTLSGCALIKENASVHNVAVEIINDVAPTSLLDASLKFDRVYIGGTGKNFSAIMKWLESDYLVHGAIIVFSVITLESLSEIFDHIEKSPLTSVNYHHIEGSHIQASRLDTLGDYHYFKPQNPCYIIKCQFGGNHV